MNGRLRKVGSIDSSVPEDVKLRTFPHKFVLTHNIICDMRLRSRYGERTRPVKIDNAAEPFRFENNRFELGKIIIVHWKFPNDGNSFKNLSVSNTKLLESFQFLLQFFYTEIICILNHHSHIVKYLRLKFLNYQ